MLSRPNGMRWGKDVEDPQGIIVRSADCSQMEFSARTAGHGARGRRI